VGPEVAGAAVADVAVARAPVPLILLGILALLVSTSSSQIAVVHTKLAMHLKSSGGHSDEGQAPHNKYIQVPRIAAANNIQLRKFLQAAE
jgi:hypothetical protein